MRVRPSALIIERNCVLTMKYRYGGQDVYALPGGSPDPGETLPEAVVRELREELGVETEVGRMVLCGEVPGDGKRADALHVVFAAHLIAGLPELNPEHTSARSVEWLAPGDLAEKYLYPNVGKEIAALLAGGGPPGYLGRIDQTFFT